MERPSSHSKNAPYARKDGRKSFFSKMKDTMRDMLSPSWLTDRSQVKQSDSRDQASGIQNDPDVPVLQPGPQRVQGMETQSTGGGLSRDSQFKSQGAFLGNGQPRTLDFVGINPGQEPSQSGMMMPPYQPGMFPPPISEFTSAQLPLARLAEKSDSVMAHEDTMSQRSDGSKSTSGCSSMIPQTDIPQKDITSEKRKAPEQENVLSISPHEQPSVKRQKLQTGGSLNTFTRRLSDTFVHRQTSAMNNRPAFNASLFDSPLHNESSLLGTSFHESSFYPGKTSFGGRSSLSFRSQRKRVDLNQSLPGRLSVPVKAFMKAKPRVNPGKEAVTSSTAKRILEELDKMPTPLNDAKRIPLVTPRHLNESPVIFSRDRTPSRARSGPPTQKLNISAQASISKNRQVSFAPVPQSKPVATEQAPLEKPRIPVRQDTVLLNNEPAAGSGKMRRDKSYHRGSASVKLSMADEDTLILPNLQTDYTLPVGAMPQFDFSTPVGQQKALTNKSTAGQRPAVSSSPVKPSVNFTFSSPIHEDVPVNKPVSPQKFSGFQFSSPISVEKTVGDQSEPAPKAFSSKLSDGLATNAGFSFTPPSSKVLSMENNFSTAPKLKPKLNGPSEPAGGGFQAASELKQGSVMDILGGGSFSKPSTTKTDSSSANSSKLTTTDPPLSALFKSSGWTCDVCLINNNSDSVKCIACQTPKPASISSKDTSVKQDNLSVASKTDSMFSKFQQPTGSWTCDACLLQNKPDANKCIACQSPKPSSTKSSSPFLAGSIQPGNWICNSCLIQNKKEDTVCGACKTVKSSPASVSSKSTDLNKSDSLFSKFKPTSGQWECEICLVQNKADVSKCAACQSPKPLKAFKHPPGDWVCDTCLVNNKEKDVNCVACNYARPGPPRTQTVPNIAKSYTTSQASGFSIPTSSAPSANISISSTGGFTYSASSTAENKASGFDVKFTAKKNDKTSDSASSGFKFSVPSVESTSGSGFKIGNTSAAKSGSGFKIGAVASTESTKTDANTSGFKFGAAVPSNENKSESKTESKDSNSLFGGIQFRKTDSISSNSVNASSDVSTGGFTIGQKAEKSSIKESVTSSVPGGFTLNSSVSGVQSNNTPTSVTTSIGGFNMPTVSSVSNSAAVPSIASTGGFLFSATKLTESNAISATSKSAESKSSFSGFAFGQSSGTNTSNTTLNVAQNQVSPNKRGREEDTDQPSTKKSFNFGQAPASNESTPFQFGTNTAPSSNSSVFGMGQTPATTAASSGLFMFGQQNSAPTTTKSNTGLFSFGQQNSKPAAPAVSSSSSTFVFGQQNPVSSVASGIPLFGQGSTAPTVASTSSSLFNQFGNSNASTSANPAFNIAATISTQSGSQLPAFSSTPSFNFGSQKAESTTTGSGTGVFNFGAQPAPATTPAFGSGSSFGSSSMPVFGSSGGAASAFSGNAPSTTPAFGATPPAFGSSNNTTSAPTFGGVFGNNNQTPAQPPGQTNAVFQFGVKPTEPTPAAPTGFNFNSAPAGLGQSSSFNFGGQAQTPGVNVFNATGSGAPAQEGRKIKKAVRKIRR